MHKKQWTRAAGLYTLIGLAVWAILIRLLGEGHVIAVPYTAARPSAKAHS